MTMEFCMQALSLFLIYACLGWVVEVVYHVVACGVVVNRGFLNGPVCPIYGFGMLFILYLLLPVSDNLVVLFFGGMLITTAIELFGGWILEKLFSMRWWDYSEEHFNLNGYICLKFSIAWGIGVVLAVRILHAIVQDFTAFVFRTPLRIALIPLLLLFFADFAATVASILHLKKELTHLEYLAKELREVSDAMTERIGERTLETEQKIDEGRVQAALGRAELREKLEENRKQLEKLRRNRWYGSGRIIHAYPNLFSVKRKERLKEFMESLEEMTRFPL